MLKSILRGFLLGLSILLIFHLGIFVERNLHKDLTECLPPQHLYIRGDLNSGFHWEGRMGEWVVLTNAVEIHCQPRDPELYKYAK